MIDFDMDIVSVSHRDHVMAQMLTMFNQVQQWHGERAHLVGVDNRLENKGFAGGCNIGAAQGSAPLIGFLNPDVIVRGPFLDQVQAVFAGDDRVKVTGCRFGKPQEELRIWGVREWVVGAVMFVRRDWWTEMGGFDLQFVWAWEETDFCRRTEAAGGIVRPTELPLMHSSPELDHPDDAAYKRQWFEEGQRRFYAKWTGR